MLFAVMAIDLLQQTIFAQSSPEVRHKHFEQAQLAAGEIKWPAVDAGRPAREIKRNVLADQLVGRAADVTAQQATRARLELAMVERNRQVIVGTAIQGAHALFD